MKALELRGRDWQRLSPRARNRALDDAYEYWRDHGFPYYKPTHEQMLQEFRCLAAQPPGAAFDPRGLLGSVVGLRVANAFQPQMWSVRVSRYRSPMDVFNDNDLLRAALERSWQIWPDRFGVNASCLRRILRTFPGTASVSNFRPTLARAVIARFSSAGSTVVDFAAGYGGRLVGALTLHRTYVAIEPASQQVRGLKRTASVLSERRHSNASATIIQGCAEDVLPGLRSRSADLVFSSPPYHDWERYSPESTQSFRRYRDYREWLSGFLTPVLKQSHRILTRDGHLVVNVSAGSRKPSLQTVEAMAASVGFRLRYRLPMLLARVPYLRPSCGPYKGEYLLVLKKS